MTQTQFVSEFITQAAAARLPVDFVSTHFYRAVLCAPCALQGM
jgi:hypothetical protein